MSKILIILCLSLALNAANLNIQKGEKAKIAQQQSCND